MRIAQVSPLHESVPPRLYGGTERVVHYLTEELVRMGHEVTLFASGDSLTAGRLIAPVPEALRLSGCRDPVPPHVLLLEQVLCRIHEFDVVHFHTDFWHFPFARRLGGAGGVPCITTAHGRLDTPELAALFTEFRDIPMTSISDAQREPSPWANWLGTVYHGLPANLLPFNAAPGTYLAFTGRLSPEKRPDLAIEIARRAGIELRMAAKIDAVDRDYFDGVVRPLLNQPGVSYIGEVNDREKASFLGNALAMLFPIDWPEPFGLVMIEAMSCGTPVIAMRRGSVPEVVDDGHSGFVVNSVEEAVAAVGAVAEHPATSSGRFAYGFNPDSRWRWHGRRRVREIFDARFTSRRMAEDYLKVYRSLAGRKPVFGRGDGLAVGAEHGRNR